MLAICPRLSCSAELKIIEKEESPVFYKCAKCGKPFCITALEFDEDAYATTIAVVYVKQKEN